MRFAGLLAATVSIAPLAQAQIALLVEFDSPPAEETAIGMRRELAGLFGGAGFDLHVHVDGPYVYLGAARHVVSLHFVGPCQPAPFAASHSEGAVLARLARVDGKLLPLVTVDCAAVAQYIRPVMTGAELRQANAVYGRALARVVAHEIYHWVTQRQAHAHSKLFSERISAKTLLDGGVQFEPDEVRLLHVNR